MQSILKMLFVVLGLFPATGAFGHSDHHHSSKKPVTEEVAKENAVASIKQLIKKKKLDD